MVTFDRAVTLVPGHSYTVDAKYEGDSDHQPASATASINIPGSTSRTQNSSMAGNRQDTSDAGNTPQNSNAGDGQDTSDAGNTDRTLAMLEMTGH